MNIREKQGGVRKVLEVGSKNGQKIGVKITSDDRFHKPRPSKAGPVGRGMDCLTHSIFLPSLLHPLLLVCGSDRRVPQV